MRIDLRLNAIVDPERAGGHQLADLARACAHGGATLVQLRDKRSATRAMIEEARAIKKALANSGVPFVVNDRVDVAMAAGADGVHLGQEDMAVEDARQLLGPTQLSGCLSNRLRKPRRHRSLWSIMWVAAVFMSPRPSNKTTHQLALAVSLE